MELRGLTGPLDPVAVAVDGRGNTYVADAAGARVLRISPADAILQTYTLPAGTPLVPIDLAVSADRLYAVNRPARRVEVFDLESGRPLGPFGTTQENRAVFPVAVSLDDQGRVYVVDMATSRVRVHDPAGEFLREIGGAGDRPGLFAQPRFVAVGPDGIMYVSDVTTQVVQMFDAAGSLLMYFGSGDDSIGQLGMPAKIVTDRTLLEAFRPQMPASFVPQYMVFVANQVGPGRIGVYAFGQVAETGEGPPP